MKKKLFAILAVSTMLLTGCGKKVELDLDKIKKDVQELKGDKFSYNTAMNIIQKEYADYEDVYDTDFMGVNYENAENILYKKDKETGNEIVVINPQENKTKEIKDKMNTHFKDAKNLTFKEIEGNLFYMNTQNSKEVMVEIEKAKGEIFSNLIEIPKTDLETLLNIKESWVEEALIMTPAIIVNSNLYMVVKPVKDKKEDVEEAINKYMEAKEEEWRTYLPTQYELFKNRKFEKYDDYLIYIVSTDNSKVLDTIKSAKK